MGKCIACHSRDRRLQPEYAVLAFMVGISMSGPEFLLEAIDGLCLAHAHKFRYVFHRMLDAELEREILEVN